MLMSLPVVMHMFSYAKRMARLKLTCRSGKKEEDFSGRLVGWLVCLFVMDAACQVS